jgi:phosphatidylserine decarboxylase
MMMKLAPEGYPFILGAVGLTVVVFVFQPAGTIVPALLTAFMLYFFRDPERNVPDEKDVFVAPADGKIILIREMHEPKYLKKGVREVSIFMSPMNVHVNRAPCEGKVKQVMHNKGRFHAAYKDEASLSNENIEMLLETGYGDILVRQVAGFVARRAVCRKGVGDLLKRGERYGVIKFSSRVDLYLPLDSKIRVGLGDMVRAGETIIGGM